MGQPAWRFSYVAVVKGACFVVNGWVDESDSWHCSNIVAWSPSTHEEGGHDGLDAVAIMFRVGRSRAWGNVQYYGAFETGFWLRLTVLSAVFGTHNCGAATWLNVAVCKVSSSVGVGCTAQNWCAIMWPCSTFDFLAC